MKQRPWFGELQDGRRDVIQVHMPDGSVSWFDVRAVIAMVPEAQTPEQARELENQLEPRERSAKG